MWDTSVSEDQQLWPIVWSCCHSLRCLKYILIIFSQSLNCSFLFFHVPLHHPQHRLKLWYESGRLQRVCLWVISPTKEKRFYLRPCFRSDSEPQLLSTVGKVISPLASSCVLSLLHAAINSSSSQAGDCSHFPPLPLQPSLHDNGDLKHRAGMICELRVNSNAPTPSTLPQLLLLSSIRTQTHIHTQARNPWLEGSVAAF